MNNIYISIITLLVGIILGIIFHLLLIRKSIGDRYELKRPKVKGRNNFLKIFTNIKRDEKKQN